MQVIPLHLPPGDPTPERTLQIDGTTDQIEHAKQLVNEIISGEVCLVVCVFYGFWQGVLFFYMKIDIVLWLHHLLFVNIFRILSSLSLYM